MTQNHSLIQDTFSFHPLMIEPLCNTPRKSNHNQTDAKSWFPCQEKQLTVLMFELLTEEVNHGISNLLFDFFISFFLKIHGNLYEITPEMKEVYTKSMDQTFQELFYDIS